MEDKLLQFKDVIDEEIAAYEYLGELYKIKQSILIQGKSDALWDIDAQIVAKADDIKNLNLKRKDVAKYLGDENISLSEIIDKAKASNDALAENLQQQQTKLQILAKSLILQENTNTNLIKHGLTMVGKTLEIILSAFAPAGSQYNNSGKTTAQYEEHISSISEEV